VVSSEIFPTLFIRVLDGIELLRMSQKYNVHISLRADPLQLQIEGVKQSVEKLRHHLTKRTEVRVKPLFLGHKFYVSFFRLQSIVEKIFELPTKAPIRPDLIQRLSRLADAFIQNVGEEGQVSDAPLSFSSALT
jgi:hypothetical protein